MTQYYADPAGSDAADGLTTGTAWASIDHALGQMSAGDILDLADGTYGEDSGSGYLDPGGYAFASEVLIRSTNPGLAIIESASNAVQTIFATSGAGAVSNLTFEDLVIRHRTTGMRWLTRWDAAATNIKFRRVTFSINDTIHATNDGYAVYNNGGTMTGLVFEDCTLAVSNGQLFGLIQSTGSNVIDGLTITGISVTGDSVIPKMVNIDDLRGTCTIAGSIEADGASADTSHLVFIDDAGVACSLGFGDGLTLNAGNCRGISIMEGGTADNMVLTGGDVTGTCARRVFGAEFGVSGAVGHIVASMTGAAVVNNPVDLRSDDTDSGTLAVKNLTVESITITTAAPYHGLLMGRHSTNINVKALTVNDGPQNIAVVDKGDGNRIGTETPAEIHGGTVGALYLKGARNGVYDGARIYQDNGGEAISFVLDDVTGNKTEDNSIQQVWVIVTSGTLFEHNGASVDDGGNVVDYNIYDVRAGQSWGEVYGTAVASFDELVDAWDSYDQDTNDENSVFVPRYEVMRRDTIDGSDTRVAMVPADELTHTIAGLAADFVGYYWVRPVSLCNVEGERAGIDRLRRVALDDSADLIAPAPRAPYNLRLVAGPGGLVTAHWAYRGEGAEAEADRFFIYTATGGGSVSFTTPDDAVPTVRRANSYEIGSFSHGVTVKCAVRAATDANVAETNTVVAQAVADTTAPAVPAALTVTAEGS